MLSELSHLYTPENIALGLAPGIVCLVALASFVSSAFRYLSWSTALYWLFYVKKREAWLSRKVQPRFPSARDVRREALWGLSSCAVYAGLTALIYVAALKNWTAFYLDVSERGWGYFALSIVLMLFLHDAYFYFTHRLSHQWRWLFRKVHRIHHQSVNPTPFADIMFHPVDALIHAGFVPLFVFLLPTHPVAFGLFLSLVTVVNAMGHIGYEFFPAWQARVPLLRWISRPTAHNLHHSKVHCNYGLYFRIWDRWLGTEVEGVVAETPAAALGKKAG
jgi:sterol desaturase/sphingolipid hydroxylase (fatty acid hydroxylase superfamily)